MSTRVWYRSVGGILSKSGTAPSCPYSIHIGEEVSVMSNEFIGEEMRGREEWRKGGRMGRREGGREEGR